jgi:DNA-binding response OmpR family regulator
LSAKKILLVDDAATMLLMEQMALGTGGYELITARDGEAAVRAALAHLPDLLVLDADMPKMDGLEVGRSLRAHELTREIPILLVSARGEEDRAAHPLPGRGGYVTRPIQGPELLAKVKSLLDDAP